MTMHSYYWFSGGVLLIKVENIFFAFSQIVYTCTSSTIETPYYWIRDYQQFRATILGTYKYRKSFWYVFILTSLTLQWRHNGYDSVSNHQPHYCLLNRLFRRRSKKILKLRVTGLCARIHRGPVNSPHKWPVTRKMLPFDDVIMDLWHLGWSGHGIITNSEIHTSKPGLSWLIFSHSVAVLSEKTLMLI